MFEDRKDAGRKLGKALDGYKGKGVLVLAIPRGGVEVGHYVAEYLTSEFSIVIVRKLPLPTNPEAGFGAIAEDGSIFLADRVAGAVPSSVADRIREAQNQEIARRIKTLRQARPLPAIEGRTVILVDDGIAMGSTMQAAVMLCKNKKAVKVVVASPVAGPPAVSSLTGVVDEIVVLEQPEFFRAVAQVYRNWYDVPDQEVIEVLQKSRHCDLQSNEGS
jgi:predicted phosphoribosyltransferase